MSNKKKILILISTILFSYLVLLLLVVKFANERDIYYNALCVTSYDIENMIEMYKEKEETVRDLRKGFKTYLDSIAKIPVKGPRRRFAGARTSVKTEGLNEIDSAIKRAIAAIPYIETTYGDYIDKVAKASGIDKNLIKATMAVESHGDRKAISDSGAIGLMQQLFETAQQYGAKKVKDLLDPYKNMKYGTLYYCRSKAMFDGDEKKMIVSYFWGNDSKSGVKNAIRAHGSLDNVPYYKEVNGVLKFLRHRDSILNMFSEEKSEQQIYAVDESIFD